MENLSIDTSSGVMKDKLRSYNTLNTLYHETQQEILILNKQLFKRDKVIVDLKTKLGKHERICINVEENEPVFIGPSTSLVECLCKEIYKLRKRKNELELKASRQADITQQEIQQLRQHLGERERELEHVTFQPDHAKDQEIQKLRFCLEEKERAEATRAVLCSSLAQEADQLRGQLAATVKTCQELLARLEREKTGGERDEEMPLQQKATEMTEFSNTITVNAICGLKEENRQLKERVAYVENLNSKWQKYDSSREDYVRMLCQRLSLYGSQAIPRTRPGGASPGSCGRKDPTPGTGSASIGLLHQEILRLNGLLEDRMIESARLARETEEFRRQDQERIQTLEQQVLIYTEDFKSERADREKAQGRIQDLKEEISLLQQQLNIQGQGAGAQKHEVAPVRQLHIGHRISRRQHKGSGALLLRTSAEPSHLPAEATPSPAWPECQGLSQLLCPTCHTVYNDEDAAEYLNHCEECAKL